LPHSEQSFVDGKKRPTLTMRLGGILRGLALEGSLAGRRAVKRGAGGGSSR
jgi:hypothetical protein